MKKKQDNLRRAKANLLQEIEDIKVSLETVHSNFENTSDPDLVDSCIYEMNAIQYRYKYLLRQMREIETIDSGQVG